MNRKLLLAAAALALTVVISSCNKEKETFVNVTPAAPVLTADEQDITLNVETNAPSWTAKFKYGNWVSIAYKGEESIIIKMNPNVGLTDRTDSLIFTAKDVILTVPVKQQSVLSILSTNEIILNGTYETSFNVTSKNAWTIDTPEWLRVNPNAGIGPATIKVSAFTEHEDTVNRSEKLKITFGGKYYNMP
ncbi:MAG: BACON domain-containing protein, partial [Bacteroidales bacterium]|nr:BACON domain-containing protein [Bacteroidales bacterium]